MSPAVRGHVAHHRGPRQPVTPAEAKQIIADSWTVPEQIRKRRRSRKIARDA